jgi:hypothetical protein
MMSEGEQAVKEIGGEGETEVMLVASSWLLAASELPERIYICQRRGCGCAAQAIVGEKKTGPEDRPGVDQDFR